MCIRCLFVCLQAKQLGDYLVAGLHSDGKFLFYIIPVIIVPKPIADLACTLGRIWISFWWDGSEYCQFEICDTGTFEMWIQCVPRLGIHSNVTYSVDGRFQLPFHYWDRDIDWIQGVVCDYKQTSLVDPMLELPLHSSMLHTVFHTFKFTHARQMPQFFY